MRENSPSAVMCGGGVGSVRYSACFLSLARRNMQDRLGRSIQDAETEYQSQAKVYRLVGITGGIFTAILLL